MKTLFAIDRPVLSLFQIRVYRFSLRILKERIYWRLYTHKHQWSSGAVYGPFAVELLTPNAVQRLSGKIL